MNDIQSIANHTVLDPRLNYILCSGANRVYAYSFRNGAWMTRRERTFRPEDNKWQVIPNPEGMVEYFRLWTSHTGNSILFSMCCVCGDHALAYALGKSGNPVSHGYCDPCLAKFEEELIAEGRLATPGMLDERNAFEEEDRAQDDFQDIENRRREEMEGTDI